MTWPFFNKLEVTHTSAVMAFLVTIVINCAYVIAQDAGAVDKDKDAEIRRLGEQLRAAQRKIDQAIRAGFLPVDDGFSSAQEIIKALPKELELSASKRWDAFQWEQVTTYLQENVVGKPFGANLSVAKIKIDATVGASKDPTLPKYKVDVLFSTKEFPFQGVVINQQIYHLHPLTFSGDDDLVEKARKIKIGKSYELRGVIAELDLNAVIGKQNEKDLRIRLTQVEFEPLK